MHSHEASLEGVVEGVVVRVSDGEVTNDLEPLAEVSVPELVASGEGLEGSLVDDEAFLEGGVGFGDEVAPPELEAEGVSEDLFLVDEVFLGRVEILGDSHSFRSTMREGSLLGNGLRIAWLVS